MIEVCGCGGDSDTGSRDLRGEGGGWRGEGEIGGGRRREEGGRREGGDTYKAWAKLLYIHVPR